MWKLSLGEKAKDALTGFAGVVMARTEYHTGCRQYAILSPDLDEKGVPRDWVWFDEKRLVKSKNGGGPQPLAPSN